MTCSTRDNESNQQHCIACIHFEFHNPYRNNPADKKISILVQRTKNNALKRVEYNTVDMFSTWQHKPVMIALCEQIRIVK